MLFNSEAWYHLTNAELDLLETVDLSLLRQMLKAPKGTPKEMIYLELGLVPFRDLIRGRRLGFLHSILHEDSKSLVNKFFQTQLKHRTKKDWVTTVLDDLDRLNLIKLSFQNIQIINKTKYTNIKMFTEKSFENLEKIQSCIQG